MLSLANVIIIDPTGMDLVSQATISWGMVVMITTQTKDGLYPYQHLGDVIYFFAIKVFGCFHQQTNDVLTWCG